MAASKSAKTPELASEHNPLGQQGLWHTPSKKVPEKQQLPAYIQNIARALMRDQGMGEQQAIATAISAVKRWARGVLGEQRGHVHPEVRAAAQAALAEWEKLRASHADRLSSASCPAARTVPGASGQSVPC